MKRDKGYKVKAKWKDINDNTNNYNLALKEPYIPLSYHSYKSQINLNL